MSGTPRENSTAELWSLTARDLAASNDLASRIAQLRQDIAEGKPLPTRRIDIMERSNKDMAKELIIRIENIESSAKLDPTDREMLQALNARLSVCDLQTMRLAELRDLEVAARREKSQGDQKPESEHGEYIEELPTSAPSVLRQQQRQGETSLAETGHGASIAHDTDVKPDSEGQHSDDEEASQEDDDEGSEADESEWPLLYQILGVDPKTSAGNMSSAVDRAHKKLALQHSPRYLPNDTTAPVRWEAITKAHKVLADPERRIFYDVHQRLPAGLEEFDLSTLSTR